MPELLTKDARVQVARWIVMSDLYLQSPALIGSEPDDLLDERTLRDTQSGQFLITGETLAGAMRSHLLDRLLGYRQAEGDTAAEALFGTKRGDEGAQSALLVYDALAAGVAEVRDGVKRKPDTDIVMQGAKFDYEVIPAGTRFRLRVELPIYDEKAYYDSDLIPAEAAQLDALKLALSGFEAGDIRLGRYKRKGFGELQADTWRAKRFDLSGEEGWQTWLAADVAEPLAEDCRVSFAELLGRPLSKTDQRKRVVVSLHLKQTSGLLIGGGAGEADDNPLSYDGQPILSGRSLTGMLRARTRKIVNSLNGDGKAWVKHLFGDKDTSARLSSQEVLLTSGTPLRHTRVAIDPFTGGAADGALFDETVIHGGEASLELELRLPGNAELGLLTLVLADLVREDIVLGSGGSIGRGRFRGKVTLNGYTFTERGCAPEDVSYFNGLVAAFHEKLEADSANERL